ncbi:MAG: hypothetical protein ABL984_00405 [Pyrinomonadaceae bacterium]
MFTERINQIKSVRTELDTKLRWLARYGGSTNWEATAKAYAEVSFLCSKLAHLCGDNWRVPYFRSEDELVAAGQSADAAREARGTR